MEVISLYEMEVSPIEILTLMKNNIYDHYEEQTIMNVHKTYTLQRKTLISLIYKISNKMGFKSQTFFLAVNYLDIIFSKKNKLSYNYSLLAVGCLIIASKYCENVPSRPIFKYFVNFYNNELPDNVYKITKDDLFNFEIIICKILDYKLNYFTIYDFNFFFFGNGIIKIEQLKEINYNFYSTSTGTSLSGNFNSSSQIKKILIKIYERSRHYLDVIIENLICLKYNSLLISICIMEKSIDYVLLNEVNKKNIDDSIDIEEIRYYNKEYFKQIMKDFYKIDYESLPEYEYLKIDCENYKLFDDIYDNNDNMNLNQSHHLIYSNQLITKSNSNLYIDNTSSTKNLNTTKDISYKQSPNTKYNSNSNNMNMVDAKDKINYLYKKVNIQVLSQNNAGKYNISQIRKKQSKSRKINNSRDNNFHINENPNNNIITKRVTTLNNFYQKNKNQNNFRNSMSSNKNKYYLKKCNTSSSPFQKVSSKNVKHINSSCNKSKIINKIKNKKRFDGSEEGLTTNSNSIDAKKNNIKNNINLLTKNNLNKKINFAKPYIKKIIQNYDKPQMDDNKKNININININNKILYDNSHIEPNRHRERNRNIKKILISKYLNGSMVRGKSLAHNSLAQNNENNMNKSINFDSSPVFERNNSNSKYRSNYMPFQFNKKYCPVNDMSLNQINSNSLFLQEIENNNNIDDSNKSPYQDYNAYKINSNYNLYNANLSSRNSFLFNNNKLNDSLANMKMCMIKNDMNENKINASTSIIDYNHVDTGSKRNEMLKNYHILKSQKNNLIGKSIDNFNHNNTLYDSNFVENYNKKPKLVNYLKNLNNSINLNQIDMNKIDNYLENNNTNNDRRHKSFSNVNILDYSTGISNEKNIY